MQLKATPQPKIRVRSLDCPKIHHLSQHVKLTITTDSFFNNPGSKTQQIFMESSLTNFKYFQRYPVNFFEEVPKVFIGKCLGFHPKTMLGKLFEVFLEQFLGEILPNAMLGHVLSEIPNRILGSILF